MQLSTKQIILTYHKQFFYGSWLLLNLIQAASTGLLDDEAYYWVYSRFPAWGYYDHPPMIAVMISAGYAIFHNELGVRLLAACMSTATLFLIEKLLQNKSEKLFYTIALSMGVIQLSGIFAVPDVPLLFFTAFFFWVYMRFLQKENVWNALLMGLSIALLFYSKYHGLLVVLFTLASNLRLMLKSRAWLAVGFAFILFLPHLYWQYDHGFPSVQFHLFERNASDYKFTFTLEYIFSQVLLAGPLVGWLFIWGTIKTKPNGLLDKALKYTTVGFYIFFLVSTFKGRVEANWTLPAFVGLIVLGHQFLLDKEKMKTWLARLAAFTVVLVLATRLYMIGNYLQQAGIQDSEMHNNATWAQSIKKAAKGRPIFFMDSYQRASKYWFYTGDTAFSVNTVDYRRNNFNYWAVDKHAQGKPFYAVYQGRFQHYFSDSIYTDKGIYLGRMIPEYFSFIHVQIKTPGEIRGKVFSSATLRLQELNNAQLNKSEYDTAHVYVALYMDLKKDPEIIQTTGTVRSIIENKEMNFQLPKKSGHYLARIGLGSCLPWPTMNSGLFEINVTE